MTQRQQLRDYLAGVLRASEGADARFADGDSLVVSGRISSLEVVGLITFLERKFGYSVDPQQFDHEAFDSVDTIMRLLEDERDT